MRHRKRPEGTVGDKEMSGIDSKSREGQKVREEGRDTEGERRKEESRDSI